jgi:hypothetical protein
MSNHVHIYPTIFKEPRNGAETYGYRISDDYAMAYDNGLSEVPDDDMELLKRVVDWSNQVSHDDTIYEMISYVRENKESIYIGDIMYEWDQIKDIIGE